MRFELMLEYSRNRPEDEFNPSVVWIKDTPNDRVKVFGFSGQDHIVASYESRLANAYGRKLTTDAIWDYYSRTSRGNFYFVTRALPFQIEAKDAATAVRAAIMGVVTNPQLGAR